jgi:predicted dehydrogenase
MVNVGIIGIGSFGQKRAKAVQASRNGRLIGIADSDTSRAEIIAARLGTQPFTVAEIMKHPEIEAVIVAVPNKFHQEITVAVLENGKHVSCEKPLARTSAEAERMVSVAAKHGKSLKTGSNHRYFKSVKKAYEIYHSGYIGEIVSFNGRIGNNGERIQNSWFMDKELSGGGTMLDNGCHLLDIARWFMGDFVTGVGMIGNSYWTNLPVEDTATGIFQTRDGKIATINSSWRQFSGYFHFEVNGTHGYITVDGRFDTHGGDNVYWQSVRDGKEIHSINYGHVTPDSYVEELEDFFTHIRQGTEPQPSGKDGLEVIKMVEAVYHSQSSPIIFSQTAN